MVAAHDDPYDRAAAHGSDDALTLLALGEPAPDEWAVHGADCPSCLADLAALTQTVAIARAGQDELGTDEPPERVWVAIADETGTEQSPTVRRQRARRSSRFRRAVAVAAAVVTLAAALAGGYAVGRVHARPAPPPAAQTAPTARLHAMPGGPVGVTGVASVAGTGSRSQLSVRAAGLPLTQGYYEVWLLDPRRNVMVAVGTLAEDGTGSFTVPGGLDLRTYSMVDVSAQLLDGSPVHGQSVLRGDLTR